MFDLSSTYFIDKSNIREVIAGLPEQFLDAFSRVSLRIDKQTSKILFCGIGGSALPANLFKTFLEVNKIDFAARC